MKALYSILLLGTISIPMILSFDRKLRFYKEWKFLFPSITIVGALYILFDLIFTEIGIWGFNPKYHYSISLKGLPIEECLFFFVVPYACVFLHDSIALYFNKVKLNTILTTSISTIFILSAVIIVLFHSEKYQENLLI